MCFVFPVIVPPASGKKGPVPPPDPSTYALVTKFAAFTGVIPDTKPVKLPVPATSNLYPGLVVPIPTLPPLLIVNVLYPVVFPALFHIWKEPSALESYMPQP